MGLDMYLHRANRAEKKLCEEGKINHCNLEEVAYWRKANQIRQWIVNNTEYEEDWNCVPIEVDEEKLKELKQDCETVLADHSKASELLPTSSGFFFGDTEYDDYYYGDLRYTVEILDKILKETDFDKYQIEYEEWW